MQYTEVLLVSDQYLMYFLLPFSRGVILMRLEHAGKIQSASLISAADSDSDPEVEDAAAVEA